MLEDEHGRPREITRTELNYALQHPTLRLVVLNSCNGARSPHIDPFGSLAHGLVQSRIPAVIAMQFKITDEGAIKFARELYAGLADCHHRTRWAPIPPGSPGTTGPHFFGAALSGLQG
jgi:hypothetical protein